MDDSLNNARRDAARALKELEVWAMHEAFQIVHDWLEQQAKELDDMSIAGVILGGAAHCVWSLEHNPDGSWTIPKFTKLALDEYDQAKIAKAQALYDGWFDEDNK